MRLGSITYPRALFTSPVGRGRRVAPGEGLRSLVREEPLTRFAPQIDLSPRGEVKRMRGQTDSIKDHRALTTSKRTVRSAWGSPPEAGESPRSGLADAVIKSKCKARIRSKTLDMPALSDERLSDALWIVHGSDYNHFGTRRSLLPSRPTPGHHPRYGISA